VSLALHNQIKEVKAQVTDLEQKIIEQGQRLEHLTKQINSLPEKRGPGRPPKNG
jgi:cell division protein FtsL